MSATLCRAPHAASPWMLFASVCLHCVLILMVVVLSSSLWKPKRAPEEAINRVTLVSAAKPITTETIRHIPSEFTEIPVEDLSPVEPEPRPKAAEQAKETILARAEAPAARTVIALKKRKKPPQRVEERKPEPDKKPAPQKPKDDPQSVIERSLAAAKNRLEAKKPESAPARAGGPATDEESARWFEEVKRLVNSRWSVFGDNLALELVTVIGVKLADDGRLIDASIRKSSGDEIFDSSAMRAVHGAAPFPSIPSQVREKIKAAGGLALKFSPGGIQ